MKKIISIISLVILFTISCCKEPLIEANSLCGSWRFESVDSLVYIPYLDSMFLWGEGFPSTGMFNFSCDRTGTLLTSYLGLTGGIECFIWSHDSVNNIINFSVENGTTYGFLERHTTDSMTLVLRKYILPYDENHIFYKLTLIKD